MSLLRPALRPALQSTLRSAIGAVADVTGYVLTIPDSYTPTSPTTGQQLLINESVVAKMSAGDQDVFWNNVSDGGGDIRVYSDLGLSSRLPVDVLECNTTTRELLIITRRPTYDGLGATYINVSGAGSQPAVGAQYGRNEVWQDELNVYLGTTTDRTGLQDLVANGGVTQNDTSHNLPTFDLDGSTGYLIASGYYPVTGSNPRSARGWIKTPAANNRTIVTWGADAVGANSTRWELRQDDGKLRTEVNGGFEVGNTLINDNTFKHYARSLNGTDVVDTIQYINGALEGVSSSNSIAVNTATNEPMRVGARLRIDTLEYFWQGNLSLILRDAEVTADFVATEHANQSNPATFFGAPTIAEV